MGWEYKVLFYSPEDDDGAIEFDGTLKPLLLDPPKAPRSRLEAKLNGIGANEWELINVVEHDLYSRYLLEGGDPLKWQQSSPRVSYHLYFKRTKRAETWWRAGGFQIAEPEYGEPDDVEPEEMLVEKDDST
jgi:hypothetical protein